MKPTETGQVVWGVMYEDQIIVFDTHAAAQTAQEAGASEPQSMPVYTLAEDQS